MGKTRSFIVRTALPILGAAALSACTGGGNPEEDRREQLPAPVQVSPVEHGSIRLLRTFSGALEPGAEFIVSPKVGGRVEKIAVNLADPVTRSDVVVRLDDDEFQQALAQDEADLLVAQANLAEARSLSEISGREIERTSTLFGRGVASESEFDAAKSNQLATEARVKVFEAQVIRAEAAVRAAEIRIGYSHVTAEWPEGDSERWVAERFVDEGQTVSANASLLKIIDLHPMAGVIYVTERDYAHIRPGQEVELRTDVFPNETFTGSIARISPAFQESSRQARVELIIPNEDLRLRPGMFVRATVQLDFVENAVVVPEGALVSRGDAHGVFTLAADGQSANWRPVTIGIREGGRVQILGTELDGEVITLGQHLIEDGSAISIPNGDDEPVAEQPTRREIGE